MLAISYISCLLYICPHSHIPLLLFSFSCTILIICAIVCIIVETNSITEGPWVVRAAVRATPAMLGKKVVQRYFRGDDYLEIDVHVGSSVIASNIVGICRGYAKQLINDCGIVLQGMRIPLLPIDTCGYHLVCSLLPWSLLSSKLPFFICISPKPPSHMHPLSFHVTLHHISGENTSELPERMLACVSLNRIDVNIRRNLDVL